MIHFLKFYKYKYIIKYNIPNHQILIYIDIKSNIKQFYLTSNHYALIYFIDRKHSILSIHFSILLP